MTIASAAVCPQCHADGPEEFRLTRHTVYVCFHCGNSWTSSPALSPYFVSEKSEDETLAQARQRLRAAVLRLLHPIGHAH